MPNDREKPGFNGKIHNSTEKTSRFHHIFDHRLDSVSRTFPCSDVSCCDELTVLEPYVGAGVFSVVGVIVIMFGCWKDGFAYQCNFLYLEDGTESTSAKFTSKGYFCYHIEV